MKKLQDFKGSINKCSKCGLCQAECSVYKITGNDCTVSRGQFTRLKGILDGDLKMTKNINVRIEVNGAAFLLVINNNSEERFIISTHSTFGEAWRQIYRLYQIESQQFTVGEKEIPVTEWIKGMKQAGYIDEQNDL